MSEFDWKTARESKDKIILSPERALRAGKKIGQILLHASDKQATIDDIVARINNPRLRKLGRQVYGSVSLKEQLASEQEKLGRRVGEATSFLSADLEVRFREIGTESVILQGMLAGADFERATVSLTDPEDNTSEVVFAVDVPVPEDLDQSYFGRRLAVDIDVLSLPKGKEWILD